MLPRDIRVYHVFSCLLPGAVPSPFALALAALAFTLPYQVIVLHDSPRAIAQSVAYHMLVVAVSPVDVSLRTMTVNIAAILMFHTLADFIWIYCFGLPMLHQMCPKEADRWRVMLGEVRPCATPVDTPSHY